MLQSTLIPKFEKKLEKIENSTKLSSELKKEKKQHVLESIRRFKHYRRTVSVYEHSHNVEFTGTEADVYTFEDVLNHCKELQFGEKPLGLIKEGVFIPIGGSAIAPHDLREYLYLPSNLVTVKKEYETIRKAFKGFGKDAVQL